jgi:hypothetical protein
LSGEVIEIAAKNDHTKRLRAKTKKALFSAVFLSIMSKTIPMAR